MQEVLFTPHALFEISRRGLDEDIVRRVLAQPGQRHDIRAGREVFQAKVRLGEPPRLYLVRVFVDVDRVPPEIVTAYRTSKIEKYWRQGP